MTLAADAADESEAEEIVDTVVAILGVATLQEREFKRLGNNVWTATVEFDIPEEFEFEPDDGPMRIRYVTRKLEDLSWRIVSEDADYGIFEWPLPWWDPSDRHEVLGHPGVRAGVFKAYLSLPAGGRISRTRVS